jgi:glucose dehydrogenase
VKHLQIVWTYDTNDGSGASRIQPVMIDGVSYGITAQHKAVALDATNGK